MLNRRSILVSLAAATAFPRAAAAQVVKIDVPFRLEGGRILIDVALNGGPPLPFLLDTGGIVSLIRRDLATSAGLSPIGTLRLGSIGGYGGSAPRDGYVAREALIGGTARRRSVEFAAVDAAELRLGASGTIGDELLTTFDSVLDFGALKWSIYVDGGPDHTGFTRVPSTIRQPAGRGAPFLYVDVVLDDRPIRLLVDTGAPRSIILQSSAAKRVGLAGDDRPWAPWRVRPGKTPDAMGRATRADKLVIAGRTFARPLVNLRSGPPTTDLADGLLGLGIIQQLDWIVDRKPGALWVRSSGRDAPPDQYVRSGLGLERDAGGASVTQVAPNGPAARAGLKPGDRVVGPGIDALLREGPVLAGETARVQVMRDGRAETATLKLANYL